MPEDMYADAAPAQGATEPSKGTTTEETASDNETAVIPLAVMGGKKWKPGDEIVLEIVQMNEDGAVVKYATEKGGEEEGEPPHDEAKERAGMSSMYEDTGGGGGGGNPGMGGGY